MLRLDAIHPVISGNKWLKLQPWLSVAREGSYEGLVTTGGPWSNHVHAAAYAAKLHGYRFSAIVSAKDGLVTPMLQDVANWGGKIIFCQTTEQSLQAALALKSPTLKNLLLPMGGEGPAGEAGVQDYFNSLAIPFFNAVFCPVGTGTTVAGIAKSGLQFETLHVVNPGIADPSLDELVTRLSQGFQGRKFIMHREPFLKKFGKFPPELPSAMNDWYRMWKLPTDIVYTGKMFFVFMQLIMSGILSPGNILLVHTGGLQGNRSLPPGILNF